MSAEVSNLKEDLTEIKDELKNVRTDVKTLDERLNGRLRKVETFQAIQEGYEKGVASITKSPMDNGWKKLALKQAAIISSVIGLATTMALIAAKAMGIL